MESRSPRGGRGRPTEVVVSGPDGASLGTVLLSGNRVTVGRFADLNDIALQPDPELLVTRASHCTFERAGTQWLIVDGGSVNGTFLRRDGSLRKVVERTALNDGDAICVLASVAETGERRFFELAVRAPGDSQATKAVLVEEIEPSPKDVGPCLRYEADEARLLLVRDGQSDEIQIRAQAHRLVRYMVERNAAIGGSPALCTHDELMRAVWSDEPMHTRTELARIVWEVRKKLEPFGAGHLIESERRRGYRLRTCAPDGDRAQV